MKVSNLIITLGIVFAYCRCAKDTVLETAYKKSPIPENAEIIFHENNFIYVMDENGNSITQLTFENDRILEHAALSHDKTKIITNYFSDPAIGGQSSKLILYDLSSGQRSILLPEFAMAGNGGVDWDDSGYIYFAGVDEFPFPEPSNVAEFQANAGANDIYKVKFDGTDLQNLTNTTDRGEADVSVSPDSKFVCYLATNIKDPHNSFTEIWKRDMDGQLPQMLYKGGKDRVSSVHDPELSPDNGSVVFSQVNNTVPPVFPNNPQANTAHDIVKLDIWNVDKAVITQPGPISIIPDWSRDKILYLHISDKGITPQTGLATINSDGSGFKLIKLGANVGKWIPK